MSQPSLAAETVDARPRGSLVQPISAGILAAVVGFASSFTILLAGFSAVGASPAESASGLLAASLGMGLLTIILAIRTRLPISIAWSTPGAALLVATGAQEGGYGVAAGAFLATALLVIASGLWRPFGRAVSSIPTALASAMLAGVLLDLCLAPVRAVGEMPMLALPIVAAWALSLRFARLYAVPVAVAVAGVIIVTATPIPAGALARIWPEPVFVKPVFDAGAMISIALPLFIVTMASQNVPGLAVLNANGYRFDVGRVFTATGLGSIGTALFGGHTLNLSAITAALCAGPDAHPDPSRRWIAALANGITYLVLGGAATFAAAFIAASPPLLIQAVAGLALLSSLAGALAGSVDRDADRLPAILTFVTSASGFTMFGIGAAFWGLIAGGTLMLVLKLRARP